MAALMMPPLHRKEKVYRATVCHLTNLTDDELRARYRFGQDSINFIANLLKEDLVRTTNKATGLAVEEQVKICFRVIPRRYTWLHQRNCVKGCG